MVVETSISFMRLLLYASDWPADVTKNPPMREPRNRVVQVRRFGGPDGLEVVDAPLPTAGRGEVRVRVLASSVHYTDVLIRRHLYPQTAGDATGYRPQREPGPASQTDT